MSLRLRLGSGFVGSVLCPMECSDDARLQLPFVCQIPPLDTQNGPALFHQCLLPASFLEDGLVCRAVIEVFDLPVELEGEFPLLLRKIESVLTVAGEHFLLLRREGKAHAANEVECARLAG
ncbi:hypothetical protein GCM10027403_17710 [Arthrobacter tecti]